jgi:DNA repair ATPase RecN
MADLVEIRVRDYRAFRQATLLLDAYGLALVAGPNNAGKSALLSAFDVAAGQETYASVRHAAGSRARIWARWELSIEERNRLLVRQPPIAI